MNDTPVGGHVSKPQDPTNLEGLVALPIPGALHSHFEKSSLTKSEQGSSITSIDSSSPKLPNPMKIDIAKAYFLFAAGMNKAASAILDGWSKSLKEQAEIVREYLNSSAYFAKLELTSVNTLAKEDSKAAITNKIAIQGPTNLEAYMTSIPIVEMHKMLHIDPYAASPVVGAMVSESKRLQQTEAISASSSSSASSAANINPLADQATKSNEIGPEHFLVASLIMGAGITALSQTTGSTPSNLHIETKVISDAFGAIVPMQEQNSAVLVASWFSAMWGTSMLYQTSAQSLGKGRKDGAGEPKDLEFAKNYAGALIGSLNSPQYNRLMLAAVAKSQEGLPPEKRRDADSLVQMSKIVLLSVSLALIGKLDEGRFNELDFEGMIRGAKGQTKADTDFSSEDVNDTAPIKKRLIGEINIALSKLSAAESALVVESLKSYFFTDHKVEEMLDSRKVFAKVMPQVLNPNDADTSLIDKTSV